MRRTPQDIERQLGRQYAQILRETGAQFVSVQEDAKKIYHTLEMLSEYSKAHLVRANGNRKLAGAFS